MKVQLVPEVPEVHSGFELGCGGPRGTGANRPGAGCGGIDG